MSRENMFNAIDVHAIESIIQESKSAFIIYDNNMKTIFINQKFKSSIPISHENNDSAYASIMSQHASQVQHILDFETPINTIDFIQASAYFKSDVFKMNKRPFYFNKDLCGVIFEGVSLIDTETDMYHSISAVSSDKLLPAPATALSVTHAEALMIAPIKLGYNAAQAAKMFSLSEKAASSRIERLMMKVGVSNRSELLSILRSKPLIAATFNALIKESFSINVE